MMINTTAEIDLIVKKRKNLSTSEPFVNIHPLVYEYIFNNYGEWIFPLLEKKLLRPMDLHTVFAVRFTAAMKMIGEEECAKADDLYLFVKSSAYFTDENKELKGLRREALKNLSKYLKNNKNKPKKIKQEISQPITEPVLKKEELKTIEIKPATVKVAPKIKEIVLTQKPSKRPVRKFAAPVVVKIGAIKPN